MYGLLINRLYLEEILDGRKTCDARPFPTPHRGRIALMDNKTFRVLGCANLWKVEQVGYDVFRAWQKTLEYQIPEDPLGPSKKYYLYHLKDVVRFATPLEVEHFPENNVWVCFRDSELKNATRQRNLGDF